VRTLLVSLLTLPSLALASGYAVPNSNPRDLGMCASAVAAQRDSGAAFALPAALARLRGASARVGAGAINIFNTWNDPAQTPTPLSSNARSVDMDLQFTPIGQASVAYGGQLAALGDRGWGVGLAIQPFGGAIVKYPADWPGRYRIEEVDRRSFSGALTAGIEVLPMLRIGGGLLYYYTMQEFTQYTALPTPPAGALVAAKATLEQNGGMASWDLSLEAEPIPGVPFTVAVDYKHQAVQELDGDVTWENLPPAIVVVTPGGPVVIPPAQASPILQNQGVEETLTIPNLLNVGLAYRVTKPLLVTFTYTMDRWEVYRTDRFVGDQPGAALAVERNYGNGHTFRAGAEYDVSPRFQVRLGLQRDESGLDEAFYSPTLPDASSWAGSLGVTYRFARGVSLDAGVFYALMDDVTAQSAATTEVPQTPAGAPLRGEYDISALIYGVSVGWTPAAK
jgi:long-chain fatty acid transport protein